MSDETAERQQNSARQRIPKDWALALGRATSLARTVLGSHQAKVVADLISRSRARWLQFESMVFRAYALTIGRMNAEAILVSIATVSVLAAIFAWLGAPPAIRVPIGILAVLFCPGYSLSVAFFTRAADLDGVERAALSLGLSFTTIAILALGLHYSGLGLGFTAIVSSLTAITLLATGAALLRRWLLPSKEKKSEDEQQPHRPPDRLSRATFPIVAGALLLMAIGLLTTSLMSSPSTEFFVVGSEGLGRGYPAVSAPGEPIAVNMGITNREGGTETFRVTVKTETESLASTPPIKIAPGETWTGLVTFSLRHVGNHQDVSFLLHKGQGVEPYRLLRLWVDVQP